jgi:hypothetical protein
MADVNEAPSTAASFEYSLLEWVQKVQLKKQKLKARRIQNVRIEAILNWTLAKALTLHTMQRQKRRWERIKEVRNKRTELISAETQLAKYYPSSAKKRNVEK